MLLLVLLMAELAEGKDHFLDQLINDVFYTNEMTLWALSAHLKRTKTMKRLM